MSIKQQNDIKKLQELTHQQGLMIVQLQQRLAVLEQRKKPGPKPKMQKVEVETA